jgi:hypothetical protein
MLEILIKSHIVPKLAFIFPSQWSIPGDLQLSFAKHPSEEMLMRLNLKFTQKSQVQVYIEKL